VVKVLLLVGQGIGNNFRNSTRHGGELLCRSPSLCQNARLLPAMRPDLRVACRGHPGFNDPGLGLFTFIATSMSILNGFPWSPLLIVPALYVSVV
jgi:hypothetical protein